jgi:hypothetical protein
MLLPIGGYSSTVIRETSVLVALAGGWHHLTRFLSSCTLSHYDDTKSKAEKAGTYTRLESIHSKHMARDSDASANVGAPPNDGAL